MDENPYLASGTDPLRHDSRSGLDAGCLEALRGTKPWVRFCSVIGFIGSGFMVLGGIAMFATTALTPTLASGGGSTASFQGPMMMVLALFYLLLAAFYIYPSLKLWQYGSHIEALLASGSSADLASALHCQRAFWKYVGIMIITIFSLYLLAIIAGVAFAVLGVRSVS